MFRQHARGATLALVLITSAATPAPAWGDGLPVPVDDAGPAGVAAVGGGSRFVTVRAGRNTVVARVDQHGGQVPVSRMLHGKLTIPVVAVDGSPSGLSHDGRTLVLIRPRIAFPRGHTTLVVLNTVDLSMRQRIGLRGDFSFDALSPDGRTAFLIQYTDPNDPTRYLVRSLDAASGRLYAAPVVDPHESGDDMRGLPQTRVTSPDGRWEYTLYDGASGQPFVHALDTERRHAKCIDLPASLANGDPAALRLTLGGGGGGRGGGGTLTVERARRPVAVIDTTTFGVTEPGRAPKATRASGSGGDSSWPRTAAVAAALLLLSAALALGARARRRTRTAP
jgi:hypothetical protein